LILGSRLVSLAESLDIRAVFPPGVRQRCMLSLHLRLFFCTNVHAAQGRCKCKYLRSFASSAMLVQVYPQEIHAPFLAEILAPFAPFFCTFFFCILAGLRLALHAQLAP
jgi:hypothetical protein